MNYMALIVVIFLTNGDPVIFSKLISVDSPCNEQVAVEFAKANTTDRIQDYVLWNCVPVESPGPLKPALLEGQVEAWANLSPP